MNAPSVTVYLPTRNRAGVMAEAAASVLAQQLQDLELIIVDDASEDATPEVAAQLVRADPRVRYLRQPSRLGAPAARNRAIAEARGPFVTGIDDDDLMLPHRLTSLLAGHDERYSLVCSGFMHERGGWRRPVFTRPRTIPLGALLHYNFVGNQALVMTERVRAVGGFDETLAGSQEYDLWTRLVQRFGPARRVAGASYVFREGAAGQSISTSASAGLGAALYARKHDASMNDSQRRSQRLLQAIASGRQVRLAEFPGYFAPSTADVLLRYWAGGLPIAKSLGDRCRRLRWGQGSAR